MSVTPRNENVTHLDHDKEKYNSDHNKVKRDGGNSEYLAPTHQQR
jgi:hypothetical protein